MVVKTELMQKTTLMLDKNKEYDHAASYLDGLLMHGIKQDLSRIQLLCSLLNNPQTNYPVIQVAGTNGKTSVAKLIEAILSSHGLKAGCYISPHLFSYKERFSISGKNVSDEDFFEIVEKVKHKASEADKLTKDALTNFEVATAVAFEYFSEQKVDVAVVEVGMGGRLDATSVSLPAVAVITNVDLDHTDVLGKTIEKIAFEKASIIRENMNAICGESKEDARKVIHNYAKQNNACLFHIEEHFAVNSFNRLDDGKYGADVKGIYGNYSSLKTPALGKHQLDNVAIAIAASELFLCKSLDLQAAKTVSSVNLPGRIQIINSRPKVVLDVSHNPAGIEELINTLSNDLSYSKLISVVAIYKDKDYKEIINKLEVFSDRIYLTQNNHERSALPGDLEKATDKENHIIKASLEEAIIKAFDEAQGDDLLCITGSFSTVSEAINIFKKLDDK